MSIYSRTVCFYSLTKNKTLSNKYTSYYRHNLHYDLWICHTAEV